MLTPIQRISREESLQARRFPVFVRKASHTTSTERIAHEASKVMLVNCGATVVSCEVGEVEVSAGQIALLPHGHWYSGKPSKQVTTTTAYVDTRFLQEQKRWLPELDALTSIFTAHPSNPLPIVLNFRPREISHLDETLRRLALRQHRAESTVGDLSHLATLFDILTHGSKTPDSELRVVRRATAILLDRLDHDWTIEKLAAAVVISRSQLTRLFLRELGMGPAAFLRQQRAHRMAELLISTSGTVESITRQVGWPDSSHAARAFRSIIGRSPLHYRSTYRDGSLLQRNVSRPVESGLQGRDHQQPASDDGHH